MTASEVLEVKKCPHGRGVFATRTFRAGDELKMFREITITETPKSPSWKRWALIIGRSSDGARLFWDEEPEDSPDYWSNFLDHSDWPNVRFIIDIKDLTARLLATRSIEAGEELFLNYKEYDSDNWTP